MKRAMIGLLLLFTHSSLRAQCSDSTTYFYAQSKATRVNGNTVQLFNQTTDWGDYYNWWAMYLSSAFYLNGVQQQSYPWGTPSQLGTTAQQTYTPTLQYWGSGSYYTSASHGAYAPSCNQWTTWPPNGATVGYTNDQIQIQRPTIYRTDPAPFYLGGSSRSGNYQNYTTIISDGQGATETPTYSITVGGGTYGTLSCQNCTSPIYTAQQAMACPGGSPSYNVQIVASYAGFQSLPLYIFNNSPASQATMGVNQVGLDNGSGYDSQYVYKVLDACGNPMNWVEVNESFTNSQFVYPGGPTSGWPLPGTGTWTLGVWTGNAFDQFGQFTDHIWEQNGTGVFPVPLPPYWNNMAEDPNNTVLTTSQWFKAGTTSNGYGLLIHADTLTKYIDHGKAQ